MQPITYFHEPCVYSREGVGEASVVVRMAGVIEHRNACHLGRRGCPDSRRQHGIHRYGERDPGPTVSKTSWTYVRISSGPGRSLFCPGVVFRTARGRWKTPKPLMHGIEKSDRGIVTKKAANKGEILRSCWSEGPDPRGRLRDPTTCHTQRWAHVSHWINQLRHPDAVMHESATRGRSRMR